MKDSHKQATPTPPKNRTMDPPKTLLASFRYLGPGLILSAAIVGSGELILTTKMGAEAGFTLLWVILLGCFAKVAVQLEYGRYCITHNVPTFQAWNQTRGKRFFGLHWSVCVGVLFMIANFMGQGGVLGGAAQVAAHAFPGMSMKVWVLIVVVIVGLLVSHGRYAPIEWIATLLNLFFVSVILYCVFAIQGTDYAFTSSDIASGFTLNLNSKNIAVAVAAFGITGVASGEITLYSYWCMEKGYAAWTGPRDDSPEWVERARGWIRVMTLDALVSMVIYTTSTIAFYILGAAVLSAQPTLSDGNGLILQLSAIFTEVLGSNTQTLFMLCAFAVLFSTIFSNTAGFSRLWTDFFGLAGIIDWQNDRQRRRMIGIMAWVFPLFSGVVYLTFQQPLLLVKLLGICNAAYLLIVAWQAVVFRYWHSDSRLQPSMFYRVAFWISLASIGFMAVRTVYTKVF